MRITFTTKKYCMKKNKYKKEALKAKKEFNEMIRTHLKRGMELMAEMSIAHPEYRKYSDMDMNNATAVFFEVFMAKMYDNIRTENDGELDDEDFARAEEAGKKMHDLVLEYTGVELGDY